MAEGIISLLKSPKKRREYGEMSKKLAAKYTERRQVRKLEALYQRVIAERADA
jgi:glycosyltransferase involved in cell wall biosynthesis